MRSVIMNSRSSAVITRKRCYRRTIVTEESINDALRVLLINWLSLSILNQLKYSWILLLLNRKSTCSGCYGNTLNIIDGLKRHGMAWKILQYQLRPLDRSGGTKWAPIVSFNSKPLPRPHSNREYHFVPEFVNADVSKKKASIDSAYSCACSCDTARWASKSLLFPTKHNTVEKSKNSKSSTCAVSSTVCGTLSIMSQVHLNPVLHANVWFQQPTSAIDLQFWLYCTSSWSCLLHL